MILNELTFFQRCQTSGYNNKVATRRRFSKKGKKEEVKCDSRKSLHNRASEQQQISRYVYQYYLMHFQDNKIKLDRAESCFGWTLQSKFFRILYDRVFH